MLSSIITMTTDFGLADPYVAEMKAVILKINPEAKIVDISNQIEKFNIKMGAYVLAAAAPYFPQGTIHVAVVDPGVGTRRNPILIEAENSFFIGPDNGVLILAANRQGLKHVYKIRNPKFMLHKISSTFHGRDIFAPAAAFLSKGVSPSEFGRETHKFVVPNFSKLVRKERVLIGEVIHVDGFGNIITNFPKEELGREVLGGQTFKLKFKETALKLRLCRSYAEVELREPLAIIGSHDFLEISLNQGNAAETFGVKAGDKVTLYRFL